MSNLNNHRKRNLVQSYKGFTLTELLVVVAIIGILAIGVIGFINPLEQLKKARDAQRKSDLHQIQIIFETYYYDKGFYPAADTYRIYDDGSRHDWGEAWLPYSSKLPADPHYPGFVEPYRPLYKYIPYPAGCGTTPRCTGYTLYAHLERDSDPKTCAPPRCPGAPDHGCGDDVHPACNYMVTSPNLHVEGDALVE